MTNEELCMLAQEGNADAEEELICNLLPSLQALAAKFEVQYSGLQIESDDLLQEGSIGFLRAVHSFRPEKGNLFQTYASRVSENAMMDYIRKCASAIPSTGQMLSLDVEPNNDQDNNESSFYDRLFSEYTKTPEQIYIEKETYEEVHHARIYPKDCVNLCTDVRYTYQYGGFFMARRKSDSPQKAALREMMSNYMRDNDVHIKDGTDVNSLMRDMMSVILEGTLDAEMDEELGYSKYDYKNKDTENSRNGYSQKTMHTSYGDMEIDVPRDRKGEFEPQVVKKYQNTVTQDMEEKIISMYAKGMTTADIESHMRDLYDIEISDSTISRITDKILPIVKEWQERPLEEVYAVVFMDAIHYHVRSEGRIVKRAVYIAIGIDMSGKKDVLGMYVGENESAKFWLSIMNSLKNRGVEEILIACVDGLTGFPQAIEAVYPHAEIQQCIIHQIRNSTKYVSYKDLKKLMLDLKKVYAAPDEQTALANLEEFGEKWDTKYPKISKSWSEHWPSLATYFKYPESVRRLIYTTNTIEGFNRQLRKVTKSKTIFPSDDSLLKMLYLAMIDITKKWTGHRQDWGEIHSQLEIYFEERLEGHRY